MGDKISIIPYIKNKIHEKYKIVTISKQPKFKTCFGAYTIALLVFKYKMIKTPKLVTVVVCAKWYYCKNYGAVWLILPYASHQHIPGPNRLPIKKHIQNHW